MELKKDGPEINYPTKWEYKIIGSDLDEMIQAAESIANNLVYEISASNISKKAKLF